MLLFVLRNSKVQTSLVFSYFVQLLLFSNKKNMNYFSVKNPCSIIL